MVTSEAISYDGLILSVEQILNKCCDKHGGDCDLCPRLARCRNEWDRIAVISSHSLLDSNEARKAVEQFEKIGG